MLANLERPYNFYRPKSDACPTSVVVHPQDSSIPVVAHDRWVFYPNENAAHEGIMDPIKHQDRTQRYPIKFSNFAMKTWFSWIKLLFVVHVKD